MATLKIYLPAEEAAQLRALTEAEGRSVTGLVRILIRGYLKDNATAAHVVGEDCDE